MKIFQKYLIKYIHVNINIFCHSVLCILSSIHKTNKSNCYCEFSKVNIILQCHALLHYLTFLDNIDHHLITGTDNQVNHKVIIHCE
jgi:ABC-type lipoprotein export system ATPase subunit